MLQDETVMLQDETARNFSSFLKSLSGHVLCNFTGTLFMQISTDTD